MSAQGKTGLCTARTEPYSIYIEVAEASKEVAEASKEDIAYKGFVMVCLYHTLIM
jgi:hypothetical protein